MSQPIYQNLQWQVNEFGDLICLDRSYEISRETLQNIDWPTHMKEKEWCNDLYFCQAYNYSINNTKSI